MAGIVSQAQYLELLKNLLPPGPAFPVDDEASEMAVILDTIAAECVRVEAFVNLLIEESDPRSTTQLFEEWESSYGLPDECVMAFLEREITQDERRKSLVTKATGVGGQTLSYFEELAKQLGRNVTVKNLRQEGNPETYHWWQVSINDSSSLDEATVLMTVDDALATWGDALLECVFNQRKPAHTRVFFAYV